jgi:glycosyltransferase involved in cell wall biosynthesis
MAYSPGLVSFVRAHIAEVDIVHLHGTWAHCLAATARIARRAGVPYVVAPHGMLDRWSRRRSQLKKAIWSWLVGTRRMLRHAAGLQFGTREEADEAADLRLRCPVFLIPNGIDPGRFLRNPGEGVEQLHEEFPGLRGRSPVVLFFSRLHPKKGVDLLMEAFARVATEFPNAGLLVAAIPEDPECKRRAIQRSQQSDLAGRAFVTTEYVGERGRIAINAADVFALPSHQEGFSVALLEALAYGLPALITDRCHMPEVGRVGAGLVVPATVDGLTEGLRDLLSRGPGELARMGQQGRRWVRTDYSWPGLVERLVDVYGQLVGKGRVHG